MSTAAPAPPPAQDYRPVIAKGVRRLVAGAMLGLDGAKLDALMAELYSVAAQTFRSLAEKDPPKRTIACKEGCSYCCHLYVQVTPLEAVHLARALRARLSAEELADLQARLAYSHARVRGKNAGARMVMGLPCPLLKDGRCSSYAERPFVCRGANSADVGACEKGLGHATGVPVPMYIHQRNVYAAVGQGVADGLRDAGQRPHLLELIAALRLALEHDDPYRAWRSGKLDFSTAACVEAAIRPRF